MEREAEWREVLTLYACLPEPMRVAVREWLRTLGRLAPAPSGKQLAEAVGEGVLSEAEAAELERFLHEYRLSTLPPK